MKISISKRTDLDFFLQDSIRNSDFEKYFTELCGWFSLASKNIEDKDIVNLCLYWCRFYVDKIAGGIVQSGNKPLTYLQIESLIIKLQIISQGMSKCQN